VYVLDILSDILLHYLAYYTTPLNLVNMRLKITTMMLMMTLVLLQIQERCIRQTLTAMLFVAAVSAVDKTIAVIDPRNAFTIATLNLSTAASYSQHSRIITVLDQFTAKLTKRPRYVFAAIGL